jgi:hypothetical protein
MKVELSLEEREPLLRQPRVAVAADGHALGFKTRLSRGELKPKCHRWPSRRLLGLICTVRAALV